MDDYQQWAESLPKPPYGPLLHDWQTPENLGLTGDDWNEAVGVFCSTGGAYDHYLEAERRLLKEWIAEKDLDWLRRFGLPMPATLAGMQELANEIGTDSGCIERLGRGRAVAFMEGRLDERLAGQATGQPDNKTDNSKKTGSFSVAPGDVQAAITFLRKNAKRTGSKKALLLEHTEGNEAEAARLAKETQPSRYGRLLNGTRFERTTNGQSA